MPVYTCLECGKTYTSNETVGQTSGLNAKNAAIGAILAGTAGAVVGAAMPKKQQDRCPYCGSTLRIDTALAQQTKSITNGEIDQHKASKNANANSAKDDSYRGPKGNYTAESAAMRALDFLEEKKWDYAHDYIEAALDTDPLCDVANLALFLHEHNFQNISCLSKAADPKSLQNNLHFQRATTDTVNSYCLLAKQALKERARELENPSSSDQTQELRDRYQAEAEKARCALGNCAHGQRVIGGYCFNKPHCKGVICLTSKGFVIDCNSGCTISEFSSQGHYASFYMELAWKSGCFYLITDDGKVERYQPMSGHAYTKYRTKFIPCTMRNEWQSEIDSWTNIVSIGVSASNSMIFGLQSTGSVVVAREQKDDFEYQKGSLYMKYSDEAKAKRDQREKSRLISRECIIKELANAEDIVSIAVIGSELIYLTSSHRLTIVDLRSWESRNLKQPPCTIVDLLPIGSCNSFLLVKSNEDSWYVCNLYRESWQLIAEETPILHDATSHEIGFEECQFVALDKKGHASHWSIVKGKTFRDDVVIKRYDLPYDNLVDIIPNRYGNISVSNGRRLPGDFEYGVIGDGSLVSLAMDMVDDGNGHLEAKLFDNASEIERRNKQLAERHKSQREIARALKEEERKRRLQEMQICEWKNKKLCAHCGGEFKGFFKKVCSECGKAKDY